LQSHVQALEHELTLHKERVKEYEHTVRTYHVVMLSCERWLTLLLPALQIERLSMQNDTSNGHRKSSYGLTGRPSMDTRLLKSFLHGTAVNV
jgi:hypothetical protein